MIIYSDDSGQLIWPDTDLHDPNSKKDYYISYRPPVRTNETVYTKGIDVVVLPEANGCLYECVSGGISNTSLLHSTNTFTTIEGKLQEDGDVKWKCKADTSRLRDGDVISASTWTASDPLIILTGTDIISNIKTVVNVSEVPSTLKKFTLTNHCTILRASGRIEEYDKSLIITVKPL